jgi:hypothetical protein
MQYGHGKISTFAVIRSWGVAALLVFMKVVMSRRRVVMRSRKALLQHNRKEVLADGQQM